MNKKFKSMILIFLIVLFFATVILINWLLSKTVYNETFVIGNTAGNLYNGGLFCERNGIIYFSNNNDDGCLYSMDIELNNVKKLSNDKPYYLNVDDNYIFYSRANYSQERIESSIFSFYNHGLYRMNKNGKRIKALSNEVTDSLLLAGNYLYYQLYDKEIGLYLYKIKIDGKENQLLSKVNIQPFSVKEDLIYYSPGSTAPDHSIHTFSLNDDMDTTIYEAGTYMPIAVENGIYFISLDDNYNICFIDNNAENKEILVDEFCSFYNISKDEKHLFYQIDGGNDNRFAMMNLETMTQTTIRDGNYKNIHVIGNYVFFRDFNETNMYLYNIETGALNIFNPPVIE